MAKNRAPQGPVDENAVATTEESGTAPADDRVAELEQQLEEAQAEASSVTKLHNDKVIELKLARDRIAELEGKLDAMVPGRVLSESGDMEVVIVERKKRARPTGRIVPKANIRVTVTDKADRDVLRSEGAVLNPESDEHAHQVLLRPTAPNLPPKAYTLPEAVRREVLASGAAVEEVR